jgi:hypothetical protein
MKKILILALSTIILTGCGSNGRSQEDLNFLIATAKQTGAIDAMSYDSVEDGVKMPWCMKKANEYIAMVMGFDGTNGDDDMGTVSWSYIHGCIGY